MSQQTVDHSALKVNQAGIILTVLLAFVVSWFSLVVSGLLVALLAIVLIVGTIDPKLALFKQIYFKVLKPRGIVKPHVLVDSPAPHNFAQGMGGAVSLLAAIAFLFSPIVGIALALLVAVLAFVNFAFSYCVGCQIYYQLGKRGWMVHPG
ncbi:MAG TPA: DUF4395 domain-containing protein [Candidatus Dormibacteraeota bacterium]